MAASMSSTALTPPWKIGAVGAPALRTRDPTVVGLEYGCQKEHDKSGAQGGGGGGDRQSTHTIPSTHLADGPREAAYNFSEHAAQPTQDTRQRGNDALCHTWTTDTGVGCMARTACGHVLQQASHGAGTEGLPGYGGRRDGLQVLHIPAEGLQRAGGGVLPMHTRTRTCKHVKVGGQLMNPEQSTRDVKLAA